MHSGTFSDLKTNMETKPKKYELQLSLVIDDPETVEAYKDTHADLTLEDLKDGTLLNMVSGITVNLTSELDDKITHYCPQCSEVIPVLWVRGYCSNCGGNLPQTPDQAKIERLRDALMEIEDVTCYDYPSMPEAGRAKSHEITREIVLRALSRP